MTQHPTRVAILMYVEGDASIDGGDVEAHVAACADCAAIVAEFREMLALLSQPEIAEHFARDDDRDALLDTLLREHEHASAERSAADAFFAELLAQPLETWDEAFRRNPVHRTVGMTRRIYEEVEVELNRRPEYALQLIDIAERIAHDLPDTESRSVLGDAWKHRSNALRHAGHYDEALDAADLAEAFYASLLTGTFDVGQAQYTRAVTLFKMTRYADALDAVSQAQATLRDYGETLPLAKTMVLEAGILIEQGDVAAAQQRFRAVLPLLERLGDEVERARVLANLSECNLRLGNLDEAMADAQLAVERYRGLRMEAESIRSRWTTGVIELARGRSEEGLNVLEGAAAEFEIRGMHGDAAFVKLDVCEELLRRGEWAEAEVIARELGTLFSAAGVTVASVSALDYLRQAVQTREATAAVIQYVRTYVTDDDPSKPFVPPQEISN